jgi:hypothetical protein
VLIHSVFGFIYLLLLLRAAVSLHQDPANIFSPTHDSLIVLAIKRVAGLMYSPFWLMLGIPQLAGRSKRFALVTMPVNSDVDASSYEFHSSSQGRKQYQQTNTKLKETTMAWKGVVNYWLGYNVPQKQFYFYYKLADEIVTHQIFPTPQEFLALADMFRNEGPITFNTDGQYFVSAAEEIGEQEAQP